MSWVQNRPLRIVLYWQLLVAIVLSIICGLALGLSGGVSSLLGGLVSIVSSGVYAIMVSRHKGYTASGTLRTALRAEAVKITLIVLLLWLVFKFYVNVNALAFVGTFILTVIVYSMALFISDKTEKRALVNK